MKRANSSMLLSSLSETTTKRATPLASRATGSPLSLRSESDISKSASWSIRSAIEAISPLAIRATESPLPPKSGSDISANSSSAARYKFAEEAIVQTKLIPERVCIQSRELHRRGYENFEQWIIRSENLYIGHTNYYSRPGSQFREFTWRNPFTTQQFSPTVLLQKYEEHLRTNCYDELDMLYEFSELGCWCDPNDLGELPGCHGDVIIKLLKEKAKSTGWR